MSFIPNPNPFDVKTTNTSLTCLGAKQQGETVHAEYTKRPECDTKSTIYPPQDLNPVYWQPGTGQPNDGTVFLLFDNLSVGCYVVTVTTKDKDGKPLANPAVLKFECKAPEDKQEKKEKDLHPLDVIKTPNNNDVVPGALFFVTGTGANPLVQYTTQVSTTSYNGTILQAPSSTASWIVQFQNVAAGPGLITIIDSTQQIDKRNVVVI
jgi:hypothetical protein